MDIRTLENGNKTFLFLFLSESSFKHHFFEHPLSRRYSSSMKGSCCSFRNSPSLFWGLAIGEAI
jgi:hypothetical protein